ncbi:MAG: hypothetical protein HQL82_12910 [Magnetococcales bacterium]|nr:hypothetical protein [Magnetococcales bacterium]
MTPILFADTNLFRSQTPEDPRMVIKLFRGRETALSEGYGQLQANLDVAGKRSSKGLAKDVWVIHGQTRSGKSHLARRILAEFRKNPKRRQIIVAAREHRVGPVR